MQLLFSDRFQSNQVKDNSEESENEKSANASEEKSSVVGKEEKLSDPEDGNQLKNSSEFKTTFGSTGSDGGFKKGDIMLCSKKLDMVDIQNMFPIAFGHHAIAVVAAAMYTPYLYQAAAAILYLLLCIPLLFAHASQSWKLVTAIWVGKA
jgi:hypothetical protein